MAALAIPRCNWSDAELQKERWVHWQYLVNHWLVPGPSVLTEPGNAEPTDRFTGPTPEALLENGWFLEPTTSCEQ